MKLPTMIKGVAIAAALSASTALNATSLALTTGNFGTVPSDGATLGSLVAHLPSTVFPDDLGNFSVAVETWVYQAGTVTDLGAPPTTKTGLTFVYQLSNVSDGPAVNSPISSFALGYVPTPGGVDVNTQPAIGANTPNQASYVFGGQVLTWHWGLITPLQEGESSPLLIVYTDATNWKRGNGGVISQSTEDVDILVPVPEPSTYAGLFALGLAGFAAYRRYRA